MVSATRCAPWSAPVADRGHPLADARRDGELAPSLAILLSTLLWGTLWVPLRHLRDAGIGGPWATVAGFSLPLVVLLPVGVGRRRSIRAGGWPLAQAAFFMAAGVALYAEGLVRGTVARVILLFYLTPVWSTLLARVTLGDPITGARVGAIVLGLAGVAVVVGGDGRVPVPHSVADWMGLLAGLAWAWSMVQLRRVHQATDLDKLVVQFVFLGACVVLVSLVPGGGAWGEPNWAALRHAWGWVVALGAAWLPALLWLTVFGGSRVSPGRVAILLMLEVVIGLASAALLTDEPFGLRELAGAACILAASGAELVTPSSEPA